MLFANVEDDLRGIWQNAIRQKALLERTFHDYKRKVYETEVLERMQNWTGGVRRYTGNKKAD